MYSRLAAFDAAELVFYADVVRAAANREQPRPAAAAAEVTLSLTVSGGQQVTFRVREWFKGGRSDDLTIAFEGGLEAATFAPGDRVLLYVMRHSPDGPRFTGCGHAFKNVGSDHPELEFLRNGLKPLTGRVGGF